MSFFSSWIKAIFITALVFPLYSDNAFVPPPGYRPPPNCKQYMGSREVCITDMNPICATNEKSYDNECVFCREKAKSGNTFDFDHFGTCEN